MHAELDLDVGIDRQQLGKRGPDDGLSWVGMVVVMLIEPAGLSRSSLSAVSSASMPSKCGPMAPSSRSPASDGTTLRVVRVSSRSPSRSSSAQIVWLSADGETPICAAARVKLRSWATARKASRELMFCRGIVEDNLKVHAD
jgi:hypothetical protein